MKPICYKSIKKGCIMSLAGFSGLALLSPVFPPLQANAATTNQVFSQLESRLQAKEYSASLDMAINEYYQRAEKAAAEKAAAEKAAEEKAAEEKAAAEKAAEEKAAAEKAALEKKKQNGGALDWFKKVQYVFPRESDAKVTDVTSGKSFNLRRTYGTNHADVEPLTVKDAQIIKDIWGGWSWERRAVVVEIGDYLIAGSMTAFPHAGVDNKPAVVVVNNRSGGYGRGQNLDSVKNNGVDGHMDIHFLNSRTHGTNQMQAVHQNMVKKAAEYIKNMK